ncbi:MAG: hypothetical protein AAF721_41815 [Myxococcota bacterium]
MFRQLTWYQCAHFTGAMLAGALAACGPQVGLGPSQASTGDSTTESPPGSTGQGVDASGGSPNVDSSDGDSAASTGSAVDQTCLELAQLQWTDSGELAANPCGDMTLVGSSGGLTALLVLSVPPILGSPWDADWTAHALYTLPDPEVVAQVAVYPEQLPGDVEICQEDGALPDGAIGIYDIEADLDFYLLNRQEVGCLFTCANVYAELLNATVDCGGEKIPLGAPGDPGAGTIQLYGETELP